MRQSIRTRIQKLEHTRPAANWEQTLDAILEGEALPSAAKLMPLWLLDRILEDADHPEA